MVVTAVVRMKKEGGEENNDCMRTVKAKGTKMKYRYFSSGGKEDRQGKLWLLWEKLWCLRRL